MVNKANECRLMQADNMAVMLVLCMEIASSSLSIRFSQSNEMMMMCVIHEKKGEK